MYQVTEGTVKGYQGIEVPYTLIGQQDKSDTLCILLPGAGYTVEKPLLYYPLHYFLHKKCDVLLIKYDYRTHPLFKEMSEGERADCVSADVRSVIDEVTSQHRHRGYILLGKSVGTRAMASELTQRELFHEAKAVWLTPLLRDDALYHKMLECQQASLCVIGDDDPYYVEERYQNVARQPHVQSMLVPGADHSLDIPADPLASVDVLGLVMRQIDRFFGES